MEKVYLDNAATTPIAPEVIDVMQESMQDNFGNPHLRINLVERRRTLWRLLEKI